MYRKYAEWVKENISRLAVRLQLIEEMGELNQALCKQIRAEHLVNNPTPVTVEEADNAVAEESGDVLMCMYILDLLPHSAESAVMANPKWKRWAESLGYSEKETEPKLLCRTVYGMRL